MSKNIIIQEGGVNKTLNGIKKIQTAKSGSGDVLWIPEEDIKTGNKTIKKNGTYYAKTDGLTGYVKVNVNVPGGESKTNSDGYLVDDDGDTVDEDGNKTKDSGKDPVKPKTSSDGGDGTGVTGRNPDDGNEYHVTRDPDTGDLIYTKIPSSIKVTKVPSKTTYQNGDTLNPSGIVVHKYYGDGTDAGTVLESELKYDPMTVTGGSGISARADSLIYNAGTVLWTNNGNRSPVIKKNDGSACCLISTDFHGDTSFGNGWIGIIVLSDTASGCEVQVPNVKAVGSFELNGKTVYYQFVSTNQGWGGGTTFTNPCGFPVINSKVCGVNSLVSVEEGQSIANILQLRIGGGSGDVPITVKWARPTDQKVLEDEFDVTVTSSTIDHDYTGEQE